MTYGTANPRATPAHPVLACTAFAFALSLAAACTSHDDGENGGGAGRDGSMAEADGGAGRGGSGGGESGNGGSGGGQGGEGGQGGQPADEDSGVDEDAGQDPDAGPGQPGPWDGCPAADDAIHAGEGPHLITASAASLYCATFDESRTLKQELEAKAMLRVASGEYRLPGADAGEYALPLCIRLAAGPHPAIEAPGSITYTTQSGASTTHVYAYRQPFALGSGTLTLDSRFDLVAGGGETPGLVLDGESTSDGVSFTLCEDPDNCYPAQRFESCSFEHATEQVHEVDLGTDGHVALGLRIGESFAGTEPGAFVRASGTYRGQAFDQRDYFHLVYNPEHHHFVRHFAVFFDEPIDGACGLEIAGLEPFESDNTPDEAYALDCELERIETLTVMGHALDDGS